MARREFRAEPEVKEFIDRVITVNRVAKVVKGGRRFSFNAVVVVGNEKGKVGLGLGKANEVVDSIRKGTEKAKKNMLDIPLYGGTIPHEVIGRYGAARVVMKPALDGTGVIAGGPVRAVLETAGVKNILTKSLRSRNPHNLSKATMNGLVTLKRMVKLAKFRGVDVDAVLAQRGFTEGKEE